MPAAEATARSNAEPATTGALQPGSPPATHGFTLVELLTVLAIAGLLLAAGLPGFRSYLQTQQLASATDQFLFALNLARSEAMQRGTRVDVAPRDGQHWERGWVVFINPPGDGQLQFDSGDTLLYSHTPGVPALRVSARLSDRSAPYIAYNGNGRTRTNAGALARQWGSWQFSINDQVRLIRINLAGRARLCNPARDTSCRFSDAASGETEDTSAESTNQ